MEMNDINFCEGTLMITTAMYSNYNTDAETLTNQDAKFTLHIYVQSQPANKGYLFSKYRNDPYYLQFKYKLNTTISVSDPDDVRDLESNSILQLTDYTVSRNEWDFRHNSSETCRKFFKEKIESLSVLKKAYPLWINLLREERKNQLIRIKESFKRKQEELEKELQETINFKNLADKFSQED